MDAPLAEEVQQTMAILVPNRFFFILPYRSLTTSGCFARFDELAVSGDSPDSPFQQKLIVLFADTKAQSIKSPAMVGGVPLDSRQPSSLYVPESWQSFSRQRRQASVRRSTRNQSLDVVKHQAIPEQTTLEQMIARTAALTVTPQADKVVLSWLIDITTDAATDSGILLERLIAQDSVSCNLHVPLTNDDVLLRADPELLLHKDGECSSSIPLAGSARRQPDEVLDHEAGNRLLASGENRHGHELVAQVVKEVLRKCSNELYVPSSPQLITTPTLWHLATPFGDEVNSQENALTLVCLLHPTPTLGGSPYQAATQIVAEPELSDRELFGDIADWCDNEGNSEWMVTIHRARLRENQVRLSAGAGIVPTSSPLGERRETGAKLSTMLDVFGLY